MSTADVQILEPEDVRSLEADLEQLKRTVAVASLSTFCLGYNTGIVAGAQEGIMEDLHLQNLAVAELVSAALLGATVGALCGQSANTLGRRRALLTTAALFVVSPLLSALSPNYAVLLFGRTLTGIPIGVSSVLTNLYITEVSPAVCRGRLGGWAPFIGTGGILVSYLVSAALQPFSHEAWRWQIGLAAVPAAAQLLLSANLPETPRWLLSQSRKEEAKDSLRQLFRKVGRECIEDEVYKLEADLCRSNVPSVRIWGLCSGEHRAATLVGVGINVLQQVSGINVFIYFAQGILDDAGFGSYAMISAAIVSCIQLLATAALIRYIDKMGRRPLAAIGIIGMLVGLMLIVLGSLLRGFGVSVGVTAWFALSSMLIYRAAFSLSLGPLPYVMTSEFFAQEARAAGVAFCWAMNWLSNFGVSLSFKVLVKALPGPFGQALIFGMYMFFCIIALVFVYMLLPETNGVSLEAERTRNRTANSEDSSTGFARM
mmetsp:Transcript_19141/g.39891  ORF Transcript_19141/g.39891 Transcript_19141/m.39891 type:complete len:486 (+) Transcript_19141:98-1555(+)